MTKPEAEAEARKLSEGKIEVTISNPAGGPLAFFNRISLVDSVTKKRILPVFYSDNYVSVLPGEERRVFIDYTPNGTNAMVSIRGWNVDEQDLDIK